MNAGLQVRAGVTVVAEGRHYQIEKVVNLESVIARDLETGDLQRLLLTQLLPAPLLTTAQNVTMASPDPQPAPEADWQRAHARFAVIRPLLEQGDYSRREVEAFVAAWPHSKHGLYERMLIERYRFGGRPGQVV